MTSAFHPPLSMGTRARPVHSPAFEPIGVFQTLIEQHRHIAQLLERATATSDSQERAETWARLCVDLLSHEAAEAAVLYPAAQDCGEVRIARLHAREVDELNARIEDVDATVVSSSRWEHAMRRLAIYVGAHALTEEQEFFPLAQKALGEMACRRLNQDLLRARDSVRYGRG